MGSSLSAERAVVDIGRRLHERGMVAGTDGNISVRLDDDRIMVTPSGLAKGRLADNDMVIVDINGKLLQGNNRPSSEVDMHLCVYRSRPEVRACVHSHAPYATAFAVAGIQPGDDVLPEVVVDVGRVQLTEYAPPGTEAVPRSIKPHLESCNAMLLRNHGLLTIGRSLEEAYCRHELVEHYLKILFLARQLGNVEAIPSDDFERLENIRRKLNEVQNETS